MMSGAGGGGGLHAGAAFAAFAACNSAGGAFTVNFGEGSGAGTGADTLRCGTLCFMIKVLRKWMED